MGTVIDLDDSKPWDFSRLVPAAATGAAPAAPSPHKTLLPPPLDSANKRDRVQLAHLQMLDRATTLMQAIDALTRKGFVPLGFTAHLEDGMTVMVEAPDEALIARRRDLAVCAVRGTNYVFFVQDQVRVAWAYQLPKDAA